MKKILSISIVFSAFFVLLVSALFVSEATANNSGLESGIYFSAISGTEGEYYTIRDWAVLPPIQKGKLIQKYSSENISIYIKELTRVTTLSNMVIKNKNFMGASKVFEDGDITGVFRSTLDPTLVIDLTGTDTFEVIGIN
jgi:hypothetical protein